MPPFRRGVEGAAPYKGWCGALNRGVSKPLPYNVVRIKYAKIFPSPFLFVDKSPYVCYNILILSKARQGCT